MLVRPRPSCATKLPTKLSKGIVAIFAGDTSVFCEIHKTNRHVTQHVNQIHRALHTVLSIGSFGCNDTIISQFQSKTDTKLIVHRIQYFRLDHSVQRSQFQSRPIKNYHEQKQQQRHPLPHEAATNLAL